MFELSALELRSWHFCEWLKLRLRAAKSAASLLKENPEDPRLVGLNLPSIKARWGRQAPEL
jgi:hypothetical protein